MFHQKETDPGLMTARTWAMLGVKPFEDKGFEKALGEGKSEDVQVPAI